LQLGLLSLGLLRGVNRHFLTRIHDPQISNQIDAAVISISVISGVISHNYW